MEEEIPFGNCAIEGPKEFVTTRKGNYTIR
jgi:hypothetical protein